MKEGEHLSNFLLPHNLIHEVIEFRESEQDLAHAVWGRLTIHFLKSWLTALVRALLTVPSSLWPCSCAAGLGGACGVVPESWQASFSRSPFQTEPSWVLKVKD